MLGSLTDLVRLVSLPILGWAAYRDLRTRRVPNRTWLPLLGLGVLALALDAWILWTASPAEPQFLTRVALSLGLLAPLGYVFWWLGGFGGADAKALATLAVLFPTVPTHALAALDLTLPLAGGRTIGVFSLTILTNAALLGGTYPAWLAARNVLSGRFSPSMAIGRPIPWGRVPRTHGRLLARANDLDAGLDLDTLRMYLRWRGATLSDLRADPETARDPASLPATPNAPGDGAITDGDANDAIIDRDADNESRATTTRTESHSANATRAIDTDAVGATETADTAIHSCAGDDPWGASAFLDDAEVAYGATPTRLRAGLDALVIREVVWITPGLPFLVFLFFGLCVGLVYGDLLVAVMAWLGVV